MNKIDLDTLQKVIDEVAQAGEEKVRREEERAQQMRYTAEGVVLGLRLLVERLNKYLTEEGGDEHRESDEPGNCSEN